MRKKTPRTCSHVSQKTKKKKYTIPAWYKELSYYSNDHGRNAVQKRAWRVISQTYRQQDFEMYGRKCPCCGKPFVSWRDGQLGHWLRYSLCNGFYKYERKNMALICAGCNFKDDAITLRHLGKALQQRYGNNVLDEIEEENQQHRISKIRDKDIVDYIARLRPDLVYHE